MLNRIKENLFGGLYICMYVYLVLNGKAFADLKIKKKVFYDYGISDNI